MADVVDELLGVGAFAARLGMSPSGLRKLEDQGILPKPLRLVGSNRRIYRNADVAIAKERVEQRRAARRAA